MRGDHWKTRDTYGEGKKVSFTVTPPKPYNKQFMSKMVDILLS